MNQLKWIVLSAAFLVSIPCVAVYGSRHDDETSPVVDTKTLDCRELLKLRDSDLEATLSYYHGFMSAKNNQMSVDVVKLGKISDQVIDYCIDNPNDPILKVFERYRNN